MIKNLDIWLPDYFDRMIRNRLSIKAQVTKPTHIFFCLADHFEPYWNKPTPDVAFSRVTDWIEQYPKIAGRHHDADGRIPKLTLFYPEEEYDEKIFLKLADFCHQGFAETEIHLHHDNDTSVGFREKLIGFKKILSEKHGLLSRHKQTGETLYGFIHGNFSLDNSRADGRWCGVNDELNILEETGCYADFTEPSAPGDTQTAKVNSIYYAVDDPHRPKSHNTGIDMESGKKGQPGLLMIQGPLALNWKRRKWGVLPRIENSSLAATTQVREDRVDLWVRQGIHVKGRPDCIFVKVYTHGCQESNKDYLLSGGLDRLFSILENNYNDGTRKMLHYVSAREMFNVAKALEAESSLPFSSMFDYCLCLTNNRQ
ncbi:MAG: hypothetical protein AAB317_00645 [Nitrospirota bacterium]